MTTINELRSVSYKLFNVACKYTRYYHSLKPGDWSDIFSMDLPSAFAWAATPQGKTFWSSIDMGDYDCAKKLQPKLFNISVNDVCGKRQPAANDLLYDDPMFDKWNNKSTPPKQPDEEKQPEPKEQKPQKVRDMFKLPRY